MINKILSATNIPYRESHFQRPPATDYAVFMDDIFTDGGDFDNSIIQHEITIELYKIKLDDRTAEQSIEEQLNKAGVHYSKQSAYWLQEVQRYQLIYEFTYFEKKGAILNG